jgi:glucose/arabinose dehydrogenase
MTHFPSVCIVACAGLITGIAQADTSGGLDLAEGFQASVFAEGIGRARHPYAAENGVVYVAVRPERGGSIGEIVALRDNDGDGVADETARRDAPIHTSIKVWGEHLYFADETTVYRLPFPPVDGLLPEGQPQVVVSGFLEQAQHAPKTFAISPDGDLFVNVGAPSNACQQEMRTKGSPGQNPCPQLDRQAGIWRFDAATLNQSQSDGEHFATGVRHAVAITWSEAHDGLYIVNHGRDQLHSLFPERYTAEENARLPAEEFHRVDEGANIGWPFSYWDPARNERMQAPEYGGDGQTASTNADYQDPLTTFPAHWAPNDLTFYPTGEGSFPSAYAGGAFIAFHGSWNRAPFPQQGYRVVFQPFEDGQPSGDWQPFASGFAGEGEIESPRDAEYRPTGLSVGPEGALYVADSMKGRIWKITHAGASY